MPSPFLWGVASAAFQVEGSLEADGRGASVWDRFGPIAEGHTAARACDHYRRWDEDVELLDRLGVNAYRFSIAWPRVVPKGRGPVNGVGLDFYDRLVDALLERGIEPVPTLFHWDLPLALEEEGGWLARGTAEAFASYAATTADRLGDRVQRWITLNEPMVHMAFGYAFGTHAPGRTLGVDALPVAHHQLLAHAMASRELRERGAEVLLTNNLTPVSPASGTGADTAAATAYDALHNRLFTDPVLLGTYPDLSAFGHPEMPGVHAGDLELIHGSADGLGVNYYNPTVVSGPEEGSGLPFAFDEVTGVCTTGFGWPVVPEGLGRIIDLLRERYGRALPPLYVTENGASFSDRVRGERVADPERISYLAEHIKVLDRVRDRGADVRGYFVWTLTDNFEWAEGYTQRFGLVHVDHDTQRRLPKDSFHWYRDLITARTSP